MWNNNRLQPDQPNTVAAQVTQSPAGDAIQTYAADPANKFVAADPMLTRPFPYGDPEVHQCSGLPP